MKNILQLFLILTTLLLSTMATAQLFNNYAQTPQLASNSAEDEQKLVDYLQNSHDMQSDFTQITYNNSQQENSSGKMWLARPGKFFWDYQRPFPQQIISDGRLVYHYDLDLQQVTVRQKQELVGAIALRLLDDNANIRAQFAVRKTLVNALPPLLRYVAAGENINIYQLIAKNTQHEYQDLWAVMKNDVLYAIILDFGNAQQSALIFNNLKRNQGINPNKFVFVAPAGVDVFGVENP